MAKKLHRSAREPIREGLTWDETWRGPDNGLIWCWERGRLDRIEKPELAARADCGELVPLDWKGGVQEKLKVERKPGTLKYLATWQGLRGEDLDISLDAESTIVCARTQQIVVFSASLLEDE
jgi:hypothetical protein